MPLGLAAKPAIEPIALLPRLAARLGRHPDSLLADALRTEYVRIPLGGSVGPKMGPTFLVTGDAGQTVVVDLVSMDFDALLFTLPAAYYVAIHIVT